MRQFNDNEGSPSSADTSVHPAIFYQSRRQPR